MQTEIFNVVDDRLPPKLYSDRPYGSKCGARLLAPIRAGLFACAWRFHTARIEIVEAGWPETPWQWVRFGGNFINLSTVVGLAVAKIGRAKIKRGPRGLFLGEHYRLKFPIAGAFTIGDVITTTSTWDQMLRSYPFLIKHEEVHTWQYFYCLGLPYYVPYVICMGWSVLRTGDRAARNFFERQAGLAIGGYQDYPVRPIGDGIRAVVGKLTLTRS